MHRITAHSHGHNPPGHTSRWPPPLHTFSLTHSPSAGDWMERQQGGVIGPLVEGSLKSQSGASVLLFRKCCYDSCNCIHLSHTPAPLYTVSQGLHLYSPLAHTPLTFTIQAVLKHCYNGQTLWQKQMLWIKYISPPVCSTCANTKVLAPGLCCIYPKRSLPSSMPIYFTDSTYFYKYPK